MGIQQNFMIKNYIPGWVILNLNPKPYKHTINRAPRLSCDGVCDDLTRREISGGQALMGILQQNFMTKLYIYITWWGHSHQHWETRVE